MSVPFVTSIPGTRAPESPAKEKAALTEEEKKANEVAQDTVKPLPEQPAEDHTVEAMNASELAASVTPKEDSKSADKPTFKSLPSLSLAKTLAADPALNLAKKDLAKVESKIVSLNGQIDSNNQIIQSHNDTFSLLVSPIQERTTASNELKEWGIWNGSRRRVLKEEIKDHDARALEAQNSISELAPKAKRAEKENVGLIKELRNEKAMKKNFESQITSRESVVTQNLDTSSARKATAMKWTPGAQ